MTNLPILSGMPRRARLLRGAALAAMSLGGLAAPLVAHATATAPADGLPAPSNEADADGNTRSIVVSGQAARTVKLEAPGTTAVLAPEDLVRQPNVSVVDALARVAGISVSPTDFFGTPSSGNHGGLDGAARGGASFVYVRGLSGSYNVNLVNGANAAQGMPYSREIQLDLLPPVGLAAVVVSKTSTADMDGDAIGGTIDFRTPSADNLKDGHLGLTLQGGVSQYGLDYHVPAGSGLAQGEYSTHFGADHQFGIYATGYYGKRYFASTMVDFQAGQWEYAVSEGEQGSNPAGFSKADNLLLTSTNAQFTEGHQTRFGGALSLDWDMGATKLYLRGTVAESNIRQIVYQKGIQADHYSSPTVRPDGLYQNGESDAAYHYWVETAPAESALDTAELGGKTSDGPLTLDYAAFWSWAKSAAPDHAEVSFETSAANQLGGPFSVTYRDGYPIPALSAAQLARLNNSSLFLKADGSGEYTTSRSTANKVGGRLDAELAMGGLVQAVKAGVKFVRSSRASYSRDYSGLEFIDTGTPLSASPFARNTIAAIDKKYYPYSFVRFDGDALTGAAASAASAVTLSPDDYNGNTLSGHENVWSAYVLARMQAGGVAIQPGLRFEHTTIDNRFWNTVSVDDGATATTSSGWGTSRTRYDILLPSVHADWHPWQGGILRGAIWRSYTRPAFFQLAGGTQTELNSDGSVSITQGNPDLRPVTSWNFDLNLEHESHGFSGSIAAFYKAIGNYLYDRGTSYRAQEIASTGVSSISKPMNGGNAALYGLELAGRFQLSALQGWVSGFGVSGNVTFQHSWAHLLDSGTDATQAMQGVPSFLANASVFYEGKKVSANLAYRYNGSLVAAYRFGTWGGAAMNDTQRATHSVDASVGYALRPDVRLSLQASNIFDDISYYRTVSANSEAVPQIVRWGRTFQATLSAAF